MKKPTPDQSYLKECFNYNPDTGEIIWAERPANHFKSLKVQRAFNARFSGKKAGRVTDRNNLYSTIKINNVLYTAHRISWKIVTGVDPLFEIDHIDGDKENNRFKNFREATRSENTRNCKIRNDNTTGFKGVGYHKASKKFRSRIRVLGKRVELGSFDTAKEAHDAYVAVANKHHGEFVNHG